MYLHKKGLAFARPFSCLSAKLFSELLPTGILHQIRVLVDLCLTDRPEIIFVFEYALVVGEHLEITEDWRFQDLALFYKKRLSDNHCQTAPVYRISVLLFEVSLVFSIGRAIPPYGNTPYIV